MPDEEKGPEKNTLEKREDSPVPLEGIPPPIREMFSAFASKTQVFPPFMEKINEEHITKVLDYSEAQDKRAFDDTHRERKYEFGRLVVFCIVFLIVFLFLTVYVADKDKELYKDIIKVGLGLIAGLVGGYGYGLRKGQREGD